MVRARHWLVVVVIVAMTGRAHADDADVVALPSAPLDLAQCTKQRVNTTPGELPQVAAEAGGDLPIPWTELEVAGPLVDPPETVKGLLQPTLAGMQTTLTEARMPELAKLVAAFGYQLVEKTTTPSGSGIRLTLHLAPLPLIRKVDITVSQGLLDKPFDTEIQRRMRLRVDSYLPYDALAQDCALLEEQDRILKYLNDEGYYGAEVHVTRKHEAASVNIQVKVHLGDEYQVGKVTTEPKTGLALDAAAIKSTLTECAHAFPNEEKKWVCIGTARFTRAGHQADLQRVRKQFQQRGYPSVRIQSSFDQQQPDVDRQRHKVNVALTIDQRRRLDLVFEGFDRDTVSAEQLRKATTFEQSGSADDVDAADSAQALTAYLQGRGFFDAHVTWTRDRFDDFDRLTYRIDQGHTREVTSVTFAGNQQLATEALRGVVATKVVTIAASLFGSGTAVTSPQLTDDVARIVDKYRVEGFRDAKVSVFAAPDPAALGDPALTAAMLVANRGDRLDVRFDIDEGQPTLLTQIELTIDGDAKGELCNAALAELAELLGDKQVANRAPGTACITYPTKMRYREDAVSTAKDQLRDWMFGLGRPRAKVELLPIESPLPHHVKAHYRISNTSVLRVGQIVVRGNFKTRRSVILQLAKLKEGEKLTRDNLAEGARKLRNTGLFNAVHIELPELDQGETGAASDVVNAVIEIEERYDNFAQLDVEGGYSSYSGAYVKIEDTQANLFGSGLALKLSGTYGTQIQDVEGTLTIPNWLVDRVSPIDFRADLTALYRVQQTVRFGQLTTKGVTVGGSHTWNFPHTRKQVAHSINVGLHYDFRLRTRDVDALRPIGADNDASQVPVSTNAGSIGADFYWEQRVDRNGAAAPLAPEEGFRLEASASIASTWLFGDDDFVKVALSASRFHLVGKNLLLRADFRYDQGFPLGGAVLLPEVERFFAGGDTTVRGYNDDRLATEVVQVGVPPIGNVSQIRVLPAGGNIRLLGSLDAQLRIKSVFATALFVDTGMITNQWANVTTDNIRPAVGMALLRIVTPFGALALEYAVPLHPELGDDPRGRWHISFAARAQI